MSAQSAQETVEMPAVHGDLVDDVLQFYGGDAKAAIRELLADTAFLRGELYIASRLISRGLGRGWRPTYDRP